LTTHNLPEADELCDQIGVFRTSLLRVDTPSRLRSSLFGQGTDIRVAGDASVWIPTVERLHIVRHVTSDGTMLRVSLDDPERQNPSLIRALVAAGAPICAVEMTSHSLEDVYLELLESRQARTGVASPNGRA
jgi:ABC-2 type transport system ATP-binding protein